ncbi:MAG: hypothetical protein WBY44_12440 [Bryobacteraceae bacterium]
MATIIGDIILAAGEIDTLRAGWVIPVERAGWDCNVTVSASIWKHAIEIDGSYVVQPDTFSIAVVAFGRMAGDDAPKGTASYFAVHGNAPAVRFTKAWVDKVLRCHIEAARSAALHFSEQDLRDDDPLCEDPRNAEQVRRDAEDANRDYLEKKEQFERSLDQAIEDGV